MIEIEIIKSVLHRISQSQTNYSADIVPARFKNLSADEWGDIITFAIYEQLSLNRHQLSAIIMPEVKEKVHTIAHLLCNSKNRWGIILQGTPGNGKTIILKSLWSLFNLSREHCIFVSSISLINMYYDAKGDRSILNDYRYCTFLFIDDLGSEPEECVIFGMRRNPILQLIHNRYDSHLPTFITTNLSDELIAERYGERGFDRLQEMCAILRFSAPSYRR